MDPPVFLTHNHFPRPKRRGLYYGSLPSYTQGHFTSQLTPPGQIALDRISEKYNQKENTQYLVMLKTLQQARMAGIWQPCFAYAYKWGDTTFATPCAERTMMRSTLDIGAMTVSPKNTVNFKRKMLLCL